MSSESTASAGGYYPGIGAMAFWLLASGTTLLFAAELAADWRQLAVYALIGVSAVTVTASNGKHVRAEPIAALYEQGRVSHLGAFAALEDQMCLMTHEGYQGGGSPDRLDALVWGLTELAYPGRRPGIIQGVRY